MSMSVQIAGPACLLSYAEPSTLPAPPAETLPPPLLSSEPVSWITPGLTTTLLCRGAIRGVTFMLRRNGEDQFLKVVAAPEAVEATFPVHQAGNYSCSYRTHAAGAPSESSATVTIEELREWMDYLEGFLGEEVPGGQSGLYLDPCPELGLRNSCLDHSRPEHHAAVPMLLSSGDAWGCYREGRAFVGNSVSRTSPIQLPFWPRSYTATTQANC